MNINWDNKPFQESRDWVRYWGAKASIEDLKRLIRDIEIHYEKEIYYRVKDATY